MGRRVNVLDQQDPDLVLHGACVEVLHLGGRVSRNHASRAGKKRSSHGASRHRRQRPASTTSLVFDAGNGASNLGEPYAEALRPLVTTRDARRE